MLLCAANTLISAAPVVATDEVMVTCDASCNVPELPLLWLSWAPGSTWQERIDVDNKADFSRDLQAEIDVAGDSALIDLLQASWKNGSHKVIRQGSLSDVAQETPLSTVPAKSKRVFYLTIALPTTADNTAQDKVFKLNASLRVTDVPKIAKAAAIKTPKSTKSQAKMAVSGVLGQSVSHATYPLPSLQSHILSSAPVQAADQFVQAARKQLWWGWLIVAIEVIALMPWRLRINSTWQRITLETAAIVLAGLLSGWPAALAASLWLCADVGRLSQNWGKSFSFVTRRNMKNNLVIPSEGPARHAGTAIADVSSND